MKLKVLQNAPFDAFFNTFYLHKAIIGLESHFLGLFESGHFTQVLLYFQELAENMI